MACILIPTLTGIGLYFLYRKSMKFITGGILLGTFIWVLHLFLQSGCAELFLKQCDRRDKAFLENKNMYAQQCYCEVKQIYYCRDYAAKRLTQDEFWIQILSIYYSVFTALLAVLSLVGDAKNDFLDVPSVLFTVAVAILVTFANAQRCGSRANDLNSNCNDLGERFSEVMSIIDAPIYSSDSTEKASEFNNVELKNCMSHFYKNLGDSERHSFVDEWKYANSWLYYIYLAIKIILIYLLIIVPLVFVFCNLDHFKTLLLI